MKHNFFTSLINVLMMLIFAVSCSKEPVKPQCDPCTPPPPPPNTYNVNDDSWTRTSPLSYQSDLNQVLETKLGTRHSIASVSLISYSSAGLSVGMGEELLIPGNTISFAGGELTYTGSLLIYDENVQDRQRPALPFSSITLKIIVK